jgi:hypothetical protein
MSADQSIFKSAQQATLPWEEVYSISKSVVIDSRQRDCSKYKNPAFYEINIGDTFKNITSFELKGAIIPKSNYNVHSSNNKIDFAIGDFVTGFYIYNGGAGYTSAPQITITSPPGGGITAQATAIINNGGTITNIILNIAGSGYTPSKPPFVIISPPNNPKQARQPRIVAIIGNHYTATLRVGEYDIGGNPIPPAVLPSNLLLEIQNSMNYAVNGAYNSSSTSPFAIRLMSQYPTIDALAGTPESFDTNGCLFNRIQVINVNSDTWEFLWNTGPNRISTAASILGFNTVDSGIGITTLAVLSGLDVLIPAGTSIRGCFDYNLKNDPDYVIMSVQLNQNKMDRITSLDDGIDKRFAVLLFDNNNPETLHDLSGTTVTVDGVKYLSGPTTKGTFWRDAGAAKPIKGYDFDTKKLSFKPPLGKVSTITVQFTKFGYRPGGAPELYNMEGREHLLLLELNATDNRSQMKN